MAEPNPTSAAGYYPPPAFYFQVLFVDPKMKITDTSFQDVSGITKEFETEDVVEGGGSGHTYKLPKSVKHGLLELKRGMAPRDSPLVKLCQKVFDLDLMEPIKPITIFVFLLNETASPIRTWQFINAYPVKWEVESFNSTKNEVAIEKIVFNYTNWIQVI